MYREMLSEFEQLASTYQAEEIESIASQVLVGLNKMASMAEEALDKEALEMQGAEIPDLAAAGVASAIGTGLGVAALRRKLPGWRADYHLMKATSNKNKEKMYSELADRSTGEYVRNLNIMRARAGLGAVPQGPPAKDDFRPAGDNKYGNKWEKKKPENRVTTKINDEDRAPTDIAADVKALKTKDWLEKNKFNLLAGGGAAAIIGKQQIDKDKKDSELRGAYAIGARGRY